MFSVPNMRVEGIVIVGSLMSLSESGATFGTFGLFGLFGGDIRHIPSVRSGWKRAGATSGISMSRSSSITANSWWERGTRGIYFMGSGDEDFFRGIEELLSLFFYFFKNYFF